LSLEYKNYKKLISEKKIPILVTIVFLLVTSYVAAFHHNFWVIDHDGQVYLHAGQEILAGNGNNVELHNAPIGGPVIYAALNLFFNDGFSLLKSIAILSASGSVFVVYFIFKNIFNHKTALIGQLFFAFNPWFGFFSIQAENELLPIFFIAISLYYITKKELKLQDIVIAGIFLGLASTIRFQTFVVLFTAIIFLSIHNQKIKQNFSFIIILILIFLIPLTPLFFYNYSVDESLLGTNSAFFMTFSYNYQYPEWTEKLLDIQMNNGSTLDAIFVDFDLFLKNYFYNLFYNMPHRLFNLGYDNLNSSITNSIPFLGLVPVIGALIYSFKIRLNKKNLLVGISSTILSFLLIYFIGDLNIHFFAIFAVPFFTMALLNFKNVSKNALSLWTLPIVFVLVVSIGLVRNGEHFFILWFSWAMFAGIFFSEVLPKLFQKFQFKKLIPNSKNTKLLVIIIVLILLSNFGYGYILYKSTHTNVPFVSIQDEFSKLFHDTPWEQPGMEIKKVGDVLNQQDNIENSYVMVPHIDYHYYVNAKLVYGDFAEGPSDDTIKNYFTRKNWSQSEIFDSNLLSFPMDAKNLNNPKPDYLVYKLNKINNSLSQHKYLKILSNPSNPLIPENLKMIYFSDNANMIHVIYKINYVNTD